MSLIVERVKNHNFYNTYQSLVNSLEQTKNIEDLTIDQIEYIDRIQAVYQYLIASLRAADPLTINLSTMDQINNLTSTINNYLSQFLSNHHDITYLTNSDSYIEQLIPYIAQIIKPITLEDIEGIREATVSFRKSVGQYSRHVQDEISNLGTEINYLEERVKDANLNIDKEKDRIQEVVSHAQNQISNFQQQFSEAQEARLQVFSDKLQQIDQELENNEKTRAYKYHEKIDYLEYDFKRNVDNLSQEYSRLVADTQEEYIGIKLRTTDEVKQILDELLQYKSQVEKIVGSIATTGMAGGYQKVADEEKKAARNWNVIVVASMVLLIGFAVYAFIFTSQKTFNWPTFAGRVFVASAFGILAAYAGKQASNHQQAERTNRKMELELASIDPYLASLPSEVMNEIKATMADRLFGQSEVSSILSSTNNQQPATSSSQISAQQEVAATNSIVGPAIELGRQAMDLINKK